MLTRPGYISRLSHVTRHLTRSLRTRPRHATFDRQSADVVPGDLAATLEAHRASNAALKIRRDGGGGIKSWRYSNQYVKPYQPPASDSTSTIEDGSALISSAETALSSDNEEVQEAGRVVDLDSRSSTVMPRSRLTRTMRQELYKTGAYIPPFTFRDHTVFKPYLPEDFKILGSEVPELMTLDSCIGAFHDWVTLSPEEINARKQIATSLISYLAQQSPTLSFDLYGSLATGLATPTSNLNIAFSPSAEPLTNGQSVDAMLDARLSRKGSGRMAREALRRLEKSFSNLPRIGFQFAKQYYADGIPIVEICHAKTNCTIELCYQEDWQRYTSHARASLASLPKLKPLYLVLRSALEVRGLLGRFSKGLSSHALFALLVAFLRMPNDHPKLGPLLIEFLEFVAGLNTSEGCVSFQPPSIVRKIDSRSMRKGSAPDTRRTPVCPFQVLDPVHVYLLGLQDPVNPLLDLGKHSLRILDIRTTFNVLSKKLLRASRPDGTVRDPMSPLFVGMLGHARDRRRHFNQEYRRNDDLDVIENKILKVDQNQGLRTTERS